MEEAEEGVDGGGEAGAQFGGYAAEELGDYVGVLVERRPHLLHGAPDHRLCRRVAHLWRSVSLFLLASILVVSSLSLGFFDLQQAPHQLS